jgi:hypothetical protein
LWPSSLKISASDHNLVSFLAVCAFVVPLCATATAPAAMLAPKSGPAVQVMMGSNESMAVHCEVELDIFSGVPNPTWSLPDVEADSFMKRLAALPRTAPRQVAGKLGYRGFIVQCRQGTDAWLVRLQNGIVHISQGVTNTYADDEQRLLERWLLITGKPYLKAELFQIAESELR